MTLDEFNALSAGRRACASYQAQKRMGLKLDKDRPTTTALLSALTPEDIAIINEPGLSHLEIVDLLNKRREPMHENKGHTAIMSDDAAQRALEKHTAPSVTKAHLESIIVERAFTRLTGTLTICALTLRNGFTVTGESACVSPENYNQTLGEKYAYEKAFEKLWALEGYALADRLMEAAAQVPSKAD